MATAGLHPEPQAVKNAGERMPEDDPSSQLVAHLAAVCGGDNVVYGAEEGDVTGAVEEDVLEGWAGARVQCDPLGEEMLAQARSLGEPASPGGEREVEVGGSHHQEVGAPGCPRIGGEEVQVDAQGHVGGAKAS